MKTKTITTAKAELLVVDLPEDTDKRSPEVDGKVFCFCTGISPNHCNEERLLPPGNWQPLGFLHEVSEKQWKGIVEEHYWDWNLGGYLNYENPDDRTVLCGTATASGLSLIEANVLLENPNKKRIFNPEDFNQDEYDEYMEAETKVFRNPYLLLKK